MPSVAFHIMGMRLQQTTTYVTAKPSIFGKVSIATEGCTMIKNAEQDSFSERLD
jgi:hypothetical protein